MEGWKVQLGVAEASLGAQKRGVTLCILPTHKPGDPAHGSPLCWSQVLSTNQQAETGSSPKTASMVTSWAG